MSSAKALPHSNSEHCRLSQKNVQRQMQHLQVVCGDYFHQKSGTYSKIKRDILVSRLFYFNFENKGETKENVLSTTQHIYC